MAVWLRLLLVVLALIECTSSQQTQDPNTLNQYLSLGYFKKSNKILNKLIGEDYQDTVQELARLYRESRDYSVGFDKRNSKTLDDEINQDYYLHSIQSLSPAIVKRRVRSQKKRREKLHIQGVRSHRAHSLESGRQRRLQPRLPHIKPED